MLVETTAAISVAKQAFDLIKILKDSHDKNVIKEALGDLSEKITQLQMANTELSSLYQAEREKTMGLTEEIKKFDMFIQQAANYEMCATEAGSVVYRFKPSPETNMPTHYICAHCYQHKIISILHPCTDRVASGGHFLNFCPECKTKFKMGKTPPMDPQLYRILPR